MNSGKRLYRSTKNKVFAGVCGGIGEYLNIDPVIIRLLMVILTCFCFTGVVVYIAAIFIMPLPVGDAGFTPSGERNDNDK